MAFTITRRVSNAELSKVLPRWLADFPPPNCFPEPLTVVVFDDRPVTSGRARKAFRKLPAEREATTLFVADDFTKDARALLEAEKIEFWARGYFGWSDRSFEHIRVCIAAAVKRPRP